MQEGGCYGSSDWPFSSRKNALKFKKRMSQPWMAHVKKDPEENRYVWREPDISFGGAIYGEDFFWDELSRVAEKRKQSFDIRPFVIRSLKKELRFFKSATFLEFQIKDFNLFSEIIGAPPHFEKNLSAVQRGLLGINDCLRKQNITLNRLFELDLTNKTWVRLLRLSTKEKKRVESYHLVCKKGVSDKFWIGTVKGSQLVTGYGRSGVQSRKTV